MAFLWALWLGGTPLQFIAESGESNDFKQVQGAISLRKYYTTVLINKFKSLSALFFQFNYSVLRWLKAQRWCGVVTYSICTTTTYCKKCRCLDISASLCNLIEYKNTVPEEIVLIGQDIRRKEDILRAMVSQGAKAETMVHNSKTFSSRVFAKK